MLRLLTLLTSLLSAISTTPHNSLWYIMYYFLLNSQNNTIPLMFCFQKQIFINWFKYLPRHLGYFMVLHTNPTKTFGKRGILVKYIPIYQLQHSYFQPSQELILNWNFLKRKAFPLFTLQSYILNISNS